MYWSHKLICGHFILNFFICIYLNFKEILKFKIVVLNYFIIFCIPTIYLYLIYMYNIWFTVLNNNINLSSIYYFYFMRTYTQILNSDAINEWIIHNMYKLIRCNYVYGIRALGDTTIESHCYCILWTVKNALKMISNNWQDQNITIDS